MKYVPRIIHTLCALSLWAKNTVIFTHGRDKILSILDTTHGACKKTIHCYCHKCRCYDLTLEIIEYWDNFVVKIQIYDMKVLYVIYIPLRKIGEGEITITEYVSQKELLLNRLLEMGILIWYWHTIYILYDFFIMIYRCWNIINIFCVAWYVLFAHMLRTNNEQ